jgi:hypothetical protein
MDQRRNREMTRLYVELSIAGGELNLLDRLLQTLQTLREEVHQMLDEGEHHDELD